EVDGVPGIQNAHFRLFRCWCSLVGLSLPKIADQLGGLPKGIVEGSIELRYRVRPGCLRKVRNDPNLGMAGRQQRLPERSNDKNTLQPAADVLGKSAVHKRPMDAQPLRRPPCGPRIFRPPLAPVRRRDGSSNRSLSYVLSFGRENPLTSGSDR